MSQINHSSVSISLLAVALLSVGLAACKEDVAIAPEPVRPVKVMTVARGAETRQLVYSGSVKSRVEQTLSFRVPGKIIERSVNIGDRVVPGQVLARLDTTDLALSWRTSDANVDAARSRKEVAAEALDRAKSLFSKGFTAKSTLDQRSLEFDQASSAYDAAVFARDQAMNQKRYGDLSADVAGIVTEIRADLGQVVGAGSPVLVLAPEAEKEIALSVPEQDIRHVFVGQSVKASYWADPDLTQTGIVREISGSADATARTFAIRVSLPNDPRVRLGQTATVTASIPVARSAVVVPLTALDKRQDSTVVWIADAGSQTVASRPVTIDGVTADGVRLSSGVALGDLVVVAGTQFLAEGKRIRLDTDAQRTSRLN